MTDSTTGSDRMTGVITLPIREVVGEGGGAVLDTCTRLWGMSTSLANWAQLQLVTRDVRRMPGMEALPRYDRGRMFGQVPRRQQRRAAVRVGPDGAERVTPARALDDPQEGSLYRLFCDEYPHRQDWDGAAVSARDVLTGVERTWVRHKSFGRVAVLWKGQARPAVFRFPYPWPVPADKGRTLRLMRGEGDRPHASIPVPGAAEDRVLLRLADGREFRRQLRRFDWLLDGHSDRLRQARITGRRSGGRLVGADLRIVADFDRRPVAGGLTATVRTGPDALWTCITADDADDGDPVVVNFDHLRSLQVAHDRWAYRVRQDGALRDPADRRRAGGSMIRARLDRARNRLKTEAQRAAARLVAALRRRGVSDVEYDDSDRSFMARGDGRAGLDWGILRAALSFECGEAGMSFEHLAGGDDADE